jgi:hypothetical protein
MAGKKVTINLTSEQQKQIKDATGKSIKELNVDVSTIGELSEKDLEGLSGGIGWHKSAVD